MENKESLGRGQPLTGHLSQLTYFSDSLPTWYLEQKIKAHVRYIPPRKTSKSENTQENSAPFTYDGYFAICPIKIRMGHLKFTRRTSVNFN